MHSLYLDRSKRPKLALTKLEQRVRLDCSPDEKILPVRLMRRPPVMINVTSRPARKEDQDVALKENYEENYDLD